MRIAHPLALFSLLAACDGTTTPAAPDEIPTAVPIRVFAVWRSAGDVRAVDWRGTTQCGELTCDRLPDCPVPDAGVADALLLDGSDPRDVADALAPPPDAGRFIDGFVLDLGPSSDAAAQIDAVPPADATPTADALAPSDASAAADANAPPATDATVPVTDAVPATGDLGVTEQPLFGTFADGGTCVESDAMTYAFFRPVEEDNPDAYETCVCGAGYSLIADGLRIEFGDGALQVVQNGGGVELVDGRAVATASGGLVPDVRATFGEAGMSGVIRIVEIRQEAIGGDDLDYVVSFSGAFELRSARVSLERGLFRPVED